MSKPKKILMYVCLAIFLFTIGMMVRRFYDHHVKGKPMLATMESQEPLHRVVEPATHLPTPPEKDFKVSPPTSPEKKD